MGFCTVEIDISVTYTETTTGTRAGGSLTRTWRKWVVAGATGTQNTAADLCVNNQFANMKSAAAGNSIAIGAHTPTGVTRPDQPLAP